MLKLPIFQLKGNPSECKWIEKQKPSQSKNNNFVNANFLAICFSKQSGVRKIFTTKLFLVNKRGNSKKHSHKPPFRAHCTTRPIAHHTHDWLLLWILYWDIFFTCSFTDIKWHIFHIFFFRNALEKICRN